MGHYHHSFLGHPFEFSSKSSSITICNLLQAWCKRSDTEIVLASYSKVGLKTSTTSGQNRNVTHKLAVNILWLNRTVWQENSIKRPWKTELAVTTSMRSTIHLTFIPGSLLYIFVFLLPPSCKETEFSQSNFSFQQEVPWIKWSKPSQSKSF